MARGDDQAWQQFHRTYGAMVFRMLLALTKGDPHLAAEALQHAYLRVSRHVRRCDNEAMWIGWLRIVARSALSDARRREFRFWNLLRLRRSDPRDEIIDGEDPAEESLLAALDASLSEMEPEARKLLSAKYLDGRSVQAIAEEWELTAKAVESRLTRARQQLRTLLENRLSTLRHVL